VSQKYQTRNLQNGQNVLLSSFFFRRASSNIAWTSHGGLHTKQQHFTVSSAPSHRFFTTSKSRKAFVATHSKTMASSLGCHFLYTCTLEDHLTTTQICYSRSLN